MVHHVPPFSRTIRLCAVLLIATLTLGQWRSSAKNLAQDINQPQRPATPRDRTRIEAESAELEATRTSDSATLEQRRQAIANYERALALWRELGERRDELRMLQILGNQYSQLGALEIALNYTSQAIQIARSIGDRDQEANLLVGLGGLHKDSGNFQKALDN